MDINRYAGIANDIFERAAQHNLQRSQADAGIGDSEFGKQIRGAQDWGGRQRVFLDQFGVNVSPETIRTIMDSYDNKVLDEDGIYNLLTADAISQNLARHGVSIPSNHIMDNLDEYRQLIAGPYSGKNYTPKDRFKSVIDSFGVSYYNSKKMALGLKLMEAESLGREDETALINEQMRHLNQLISDYSDPQKRNPAVRALQFAAQSSVYTAAIGLSAALHPALGFAVGTTMMSGGVYNSLRESGVEAANAAPIALGVGALASVIETQLGVVGGLVARAGGKTLQGAVSKRITQELVARLGTKGVWAQAAIGIGTRYAANALGEGLEEILQEIAEIGGLELANIVQQEGMQITEERQKYLKRTWDAGVAGFASALVMGFVGINVDAFATTANMIKAKNLADATPSFESFKKESKPLFNDKLSDEEIEAQQKAIHHGRRNIRDREEAAALEGVRETADLGADEEQQEAEKQAPPLGELYRRPNGRLYLDYGDGIAKAGDPRTKARDGYVRFHESAGKVTVDEFHVRPERDSPEYRREFWREFSERHPGRELAWSPATEAGINIREDLIRNNPLGEKAGLSYFAESDVQDMDGARYRNQVIAEIARHFPLSSGTEHALAAAELEHFADMQHSTLEEYIGRNFTGGLKGMFTTVPNQEIYAAATEGAKIKGAVSFEDVTRDAKAIIYVSKNADLTTFIHEMGHIYRRRLQGEMLAEAERLWGVRDGKWTAGHEEQFTEDLERWRRDGKAPSPEMQAFFEKFAEFLKKIYNAISRREEVPPEIAAFFEKLYAREQAEGNASKNPDSVVKTAQSVTQTGRNVPETGGSVPNDPEAARKAIEGLQRHEQEKGTAGGTEARLGASAEQPGANLGSAPDGNSGLAAIRERYRAADKEYGDTDSININGTEIEGRWVLAEAETPTASHDEQTFNETEGFPKANGKTVNDRDYKRDKAAQEAVVTMAANYDSRALEGVIITTDGIIISGNNRTMSGKLAARKGTDGKYLAALQKKAGRYGFTAEHIQRFSHPRLLFEAEANGQYDTALFAQFNQSTTKAIDPVEAAVKMAKLIKDPTVKSIAAAIAEHESIEDLYKDRKALQEIFNTLKAGRLVGEYDLPQYFTEQGGISGAGEDLLENALLGATLSEDNIRVLSEIKGLRRKLARSLPQMVESRAMGDYSVIPEVNEAVRIAAEVERNSKTWKGVEDWAAQQGFDFMEQRNQIAIELARQLGGKNQAGFSDFMGGLNAVLADAASGQADLLADTVESKEGIVRRFLGIKAEIAEIRAANNKVITDENATVRERSQAALVNAGLARAEAGGTLFQAKTFFQFDESEKSDIITDEELEEIGLAYGSREKYEQALRDAAGRLIHRRARTGISNRAAQQGLPARRGKSHLAESELSKLKRINITGKQLHSREDAAALFSLFRDPRVEIFNIIYTSETGEVLAHTAWTSGLINRAKVADKNSINEAFSHIRKTIEGLNAKYIWIAHNHPSGIINESSEDVAVTKLYQNEFSDNFAGHIVLDHDKFNFIVNERITEYELKSPAKNFLPKALSTQDMAMRDTIASDFQNILNIKNDINVLAVLDNQYRIVSWNYLSGNASAGDIKNYMKVTGGASVIVLSNNASGYWYYRGISYNNPQGPNSVFLDVIKVSKETGEAEEGYRKNYPQWADWEARSRDVMHLVDNQTDQPVLFQLEDELVEEAAQYGSWEEFRDAYQEKNSAILNGDPIAKVSSGNIPIIDGKPITTALDWLDKNPVGTVKTVIGDVEVSRRGIRDSMSHNLYKNKVFVLPAIKPALEKGAYLGSTPDWTKENIENHYFAAPVDLDNERKLVFIRVIEENKAQKKFYVHEVFTEDEIIKPETSDLHSMQTSSIRNVSDLYRSLIHDALNVKNSFIADNAWYRSLWQDARKIHKGGTLFQEDEKPTRAEELDKRFYQEADKAYLTEALRAIHEILNDRTLEPAEGEDRAAYDRAQRLQSRIRAELDMPVIGMAAQVKTSGNIFSGQYNRLKKHIKDRPREFRSLFADIMNQAEYLEGLAETKDGEPYARLADPRAARQDLKTRLKEIARIVRETDPALAQGIEDETVSYDDPRIAAFERGAETEYDKSKAAMDALEQETGEDFARLANSAHKRIIDLCGKMLSAREKLKGSNDQVQRMIGEHGSIAEPYRRQQRLDQANYEQAFKAYSDLIALHGKDAEVREAIARLEARAAERERQQGINRKRRAAKAFREIKMRAVKRVIRNAPETISHGQRVIVKAVQRLFIPSLIEYGDRLLGAEEGPLLRQAYEYWHMDEEYRNKIEKSMREREHGSHFARLEELMERPWDFLGKKDRQTIIKLLPKETATSGMDLQRLAREYQESMQLDIEENVINGKAQFTVGAELDQGMKAALGPDLYSRIRNKPLGEWSMGELAELARAVDRLTVEGRAELKAKREARRIIEQRYRDDVLKAIRKTGLRIDDGDTPEEKKRKEAAQRRVLSKYASGDRRNRFWNNFFDANLRRFTTAMDGGRKGIFTSLLYWGENDAYNARERQIAARRMAIDQAMSDNKITLDELYNVVEIPELEAASPLDAAAKEMGLPEAAWSMDAYFKNNPKPGLEGTDLYRVSGGKITVDDLLYIMRGANNEETRKAITYGNLSNAAERAHYESKGNSLGEMAAWHNIGHYRLMRILSFANDYFAKPENQKFLKLTEAIGQDYGRNGERLNSAMIEMFNRPMWRVQEYVPMNRREQTGGENENRVIEDLLGVTGAGQKWVSKGWSEKRIYISPFHQKPIELGLYKTWARSVADTEHFLAYAPLVRTLNAVFKGYDTGELRQAASDRWGNAATKRIDDAIAEFANPSPTRHRDGLDNLVRALRGKTATAYLGWKTSGVLLQAVTSPWPYLQEINPAHYISALLEVAGGFGKINDFIREKSIFMRNRQFDPMMKIIKEQMEKNENRSLAGIGRFNALGMKGLEQIDWACVAPGWLAKYRAELANVAKEQEAEYQGLLQKYQGSEWADVLPTDESKANRAMAEIMNDEQQDAEAVARADDAVRRMQPSSRATDQAAFFKNRNEIVSAVLQFQVSLNVIWQNIRYDLPLAVREKQALTVAGMVTGYAMAGICLGMLFDGGDEEEKKGRNWGAWLLYHSLAQFAESVPVIGFLLSDRLEKITTGKPGFQGSQGLFPVIEKAAGGITDFSDSLREDNPDKQREKAYRAISKMAEAFGIALGLPVSGAKELLRAAGIGDGDGVLDFNPGALLGRRQ